LYSFLLEPIEPDLAGAHQVVVIPHGALHGVPFQALTGGATDTPIGHAADISYAPSCAVLAACYERKGPTAAPQNPLLVGISDAAMPQVAVEIATLQSMFKRALVLTGQDATEAAFRSAAEHADVIHLASHAVFRADNPWFSAVRLADGWLTANDLASIRLGASLVTLSACETGLNYVTAGDELIGFARGLLQAGASSVVLSLWPVSDASTAHLMGSFYAHLQAGHGPAAAMRRAQMDARLLHAHPYHWASFVVLGRP
jgi:CHAT domain-containing protein